MNTEVKKLLDKALGHRHCGNNGTAFLSLCEAIYVLNESVLHKSDLPIVENPHCCPKKKPLTLDDLKRDFEIRRRK